MPKSTLTEKRYAVCIGINEYQPSAGLSSLRYAEGDAQAMDSLLEQLGFEAENRCLLLGKAATLDAVNDALSTMILDKPGKHDLVVFYFAGHSLPLTINEREVVEGAEPRSEVFLTTYDFDREKIKGSLAFRMQRALAMQRLRKDFFEGEGSRKRLFIFDSCYSGDFYGPRYRDEADPIQGYIKHMLDSSSTGRVALSSCLPIQKAVEDSALGHGRFTYFLLEALSGRDHEALRRDGCVTVSSLFEYIAKKLPPEQRPVLSGVQQDIFELVCYSDKMEPMHHPMAESEDVKRKERETRLRTMLADHSSFMRDRLSSFVGRVQELQQIRQHITEIQQTGGYVTITGQAGQGKSSIIAKLVEEYGPKNVAFHFIPFNPGPDHQVGLLRNIMARLILKYDLSDLYVASESRPALRDYFPKVLGELAAKGGWEVIFIDGLDQLEEDANGVRDLAFLPNDPPQGVVFVLGTRPNDTLRPLELLKPRYEYELPDLSREDFDLILHHRHVTLDRSLADRFYQVMQGNALYLDLLAKELAERGTTTSEAFIKQIADNPEHLFSLSMTRLKRQPVEWREVIKPVLGVLLVAQEPLGVRHIRQILGVADDRLREGMERLGGLIVSDWQQRYTLFHLKLYEYLSQDEERPDKEYIFASDEVEGWHKRLAQWCAGDDLSIIWQDVTHNPAEQRRLEYARQHYLAHLYHAQQREQLFEVLDEGEYGQAKLHADPSTSLYAQDLDLGRQAAAWEGWTFEQGIALLPRLWQYTLLRCSLTSRADQYPLEAFRLLVLLKRKQEALGLAELLTDPVKKVSALLAIAGQLGEQPGQEKEQLALLLRIGEIVRTLEHSDERAEALADLGSILAQAHRREQAEAVWAEAQAVIRTIEGSYWRAGALAKLGSAMAQAHRREQAETVWTEAQTVIRTIKYRDEQDGALGQLAAALAQAQCWKRAETVIYMLENSYWRARALAQLGSALAQAQRWEQAEIAIHIIEDNKERAEALAQLGSALAQAQRWEQAETVWTEAQTVIRTLEDSDEQAEALAQLAATLAQAQQRERAEAIWTEAQAVIHTLADSDEQAEALAQLAAALAQVQQWERAERVIHMLGFFYEQARALRQLAAALAQAQQWERAEAVIRTLKFSYEQDGALRQLAAALAQAQQWEQAEAVIRTIEFSDEQDGALRQLAAALAQAQQWEQAEAVRELRTALVQAQQWEQAEAVIRIIKDREERARALEQLGSALMQAQQWERAEAVIRTLEFSDERVRALEQLGSALMQAQQWEQAERVIRTIEFSDERVRALEQLGSALMQAQQWERAEAIWTEAQAVIRTIKYRYGRARRLVELAATLAQAQCWERAEAVGTEAQTVIHTLEDSDERVEALAALGTALVQAQRWEQAEAVIGMIEFSDEQAEALGKLGMALAQAQQWDRAEAVWTEAQAVIYTIEDSYWRARALGKLGTALVQAQNWDRAEAVIRTLEDSDERAEALAQLGAEMAAAGKYEQLLRFIQRSCLLASTRDDAFSPFSLATKFIPRNPELGVALHEAFTWVDTFLKG